MEDGQEGDLFLIVHPTVVLLDLFSTIDSFTVCTTTVGQTSIRDR